MTHYQDHIMPLSLASPGETVSIVGIDAGRGLGRKLVDMGLVPGTEIKVVTAHGGPVIVEVKGTRLALGHGMAHKILVRFKNGS